MLCGGLDCNDNNYLIKPNSNEICDNLDNNCNNIIDENLIIAFGTDTGACELGTKTCINGNFIIAQPSIEPKQEICNNMDDNCDSINDDIKEIKIKGKGDFIVDESLGTKGWPINEEWNFKFESTNLLIVERAKTQNLFSSNSVAVLDFPSLNLQLIFLRATIKY